MTVKNSNLKEQIRAIEYLALALKPLFHYKPHCRTDSSFLGDKSYRDLFRKKIEEAFKFKYTKGEENDTVLANTNTSLI
jgi:hypothetical protein